MAVEFVDAPPPPKRDRISSPDVIEELRARPGEWALLWRYAGTHGATMARQYFFRRYGAATGVELVARVRDGGSVLYGRYTAMGPCVHCGLQFATHPTDACRRGYDPDPSWAVT